MGAKSDIGWTDASWTPIRAKVKDDANEIAKSPKYKHLLPMIHPGAVGPHCEKVSPGCVNCYSECNNGRCLPHNGTGLPFTRLARDLVDVFVDEDILRQPLGWKKARKVFVCSQTDLFGEFVPDEFIDRVFAVMSLCPQHTFQILTKRPERMQKYLANWPAGMGRGHHIALQRNEAGYRLSSVPAKHHKSGSFSDGTGPQVKLPLPNVWLGTSVEDQERADERIPWLLKTPAAVRFLSCEPLLGPINLAEIPAPAELQHAGAGRLKFDALKSNDSRYYEADNHISWVIAGGESGPGSRPLDINWIRSIVLQCENAQVPVFVKQLGANPYLSIPVLNGDRPREIKLKSRKGEDMSEWPEDLRIQQFPTVTA